MSFDWKKELREGFRWRKVYTYECILGGTVMILMLLSKCLYG